MMTAKRRARAIRWLIRTQTNTPFEDRAWAVKCGARYFAGLNASGALRFACCFSAAQLIGDELTAKIIAAVISDARPGAIMRTVKVSAA